MQPKAKPPKQGCRVPTAPGYFEDEVEEEIRSDENQACEGRPAKESPRPSTQYPHRDSIIATAYSLCKQNPHVIRPQFEHVFISPLPLPRGYLPSGRSVKKPDPRKFRTCLQE